MSASVFSALPNDLIMRIIKMNTDNQREDREDHEDDFQYCLEEIERVGFSVGLWDEEADEDEGVFSDQFFCALYHDDSLTDKIIDYRRNSTPYRDDSY